MDALVWLWYRIWRFLLSLALTGLPDQGQILLDLASTRAMLKFLHRLLPSNHLYYTHQFQLAEDSIVILYHKTSLCSFVEKSDYMKILINWLLSGQLPR